MNKNLQHNLNDQIWIKGEKWNLLVDYGANGNFL